MIGDDDRTKPAGLPPLDVEKTTAAPALAQVAELRASFGEGQRKSLPLRGIAETIVVGRGTACDWQIDDPSLSRRHCELRWDGRDLWVHDLGSINGTRVQGRPANARSKVGADEIVQLGNVFVSIVPVSERLDRNVDAEQTHAVPALAAAGAAGETTPGPARSRPGETRPPLDPQETKIRPAPLAGADRTSQVGSPRAGAPRAQVFRPPRDGARMDEPTRRYDTSAALVRPPERHFDLSGVAARLEQAWRANKRPFFLAGVTALVAVALAVHELGRPSADDSGAVIATGAAPDPTTTATSDALEHAPAAGSSDVGVDPSVDRDQDLADAVAAYENGRPQDALRYFRRLALDPRDKVARFMVQLIEDRGAAK